MIDRKNAQLRVLHCIPTLEGGGAERQLRELAPRLAERGIETAILARFSPTDPLPPKVQRFPISGGHKDPRLALDLWRAMRRYRPHIVQSWLTQMDLLCGSILGVRATKWVLSERASALAYPPTLKNRLRRMLGRQADLIIANSREGLKAWNGDGLVIPNGIALADVDCVPAGVHRQRPELQGRFLVISLGRLDQQKCLPLLIAAIDRARKDVPNVTLLMLGTGPDGATLQELVRSRNLDSHVRFLGFQPDRIQWLKSADLFVSASYFEGHPNAVLEAATARIPMVLSDIAEHRDAASDGARFVAVGDEAGFAEAIVQLARSETERLRLAAVARRKAEDFSIEAAADAYAEAYRELVASDPIRSQM